MPIVTTDRVQETTAASFAGTGAVQLDGVPTNPAGRVSFSSGIGDGNQTVFLIDDNAGNWEISAGTFTFGSPDVLSRDTVIASSANGAKVSFTAGVKDVKVVASGQRLLMLDNAGRVFDGLGQARPGMTLQVVTSSGAYTPPPGLSSVLVMACGGGGGGGGAAGSASQSGAGGGGGAGEFALKRIAADSIGATETVSIGAGGAGGAAGANNGNNGGATSFGAHLSANGGAGGGGAASSSFVEYHANGGGGGNGGIGADIAFAGAPGHAAVSVGNNSNLVGPNGGTGPFGGAGPGLFISAGNGGAGVDGTGSGGAGGASHSGTLRAGGSGGSGFCIVLEFY